MRDIPEDGRLVIFTVLLTVFADDTGAYFVGRMIGRHKMAPRISPGKSWEGFVAGTIVAMAVSFFAMYDQGFVSNWEALVLGAAIAFASTLGDLFECADQARPGRQGLGPGAGGARRHARPARLAAVGGAGGVLRRARADVSTR